MKTVNITNVLLGIIITFLSVALLYVAQDLLIPLVVALLLTFVFSPLVEWLHARKIPRLLGILLVFIIIFAFAFLVGYFCYITINSMVKQLPKYEARFETVLTWLNQNIPLADGSLSHEGVGKRVSAMILDSGKYLAGFLAGFGMMLLFLVFMLLERPMLSHKMMDAFHSQMILKINRIVTHITEQFGRYLTVKLLVSIANGGLVWLGLELIGVDFALIWGVLTFFFNFIPNVGSILVSAFTILFSLVQFFPSWNETILVCVVLLVAQIITGNLMEPKMQGDWLNLSPVIIIVSLILWGLLWGIAGMFLAVPLTVALKITFEHIPLLHPVSILMGTGNRKSKTQEPPAEI